MVRYLPLDRVPGFKKSTISDYKRRWFPNMGPLKSGRKPEITAAIKSYIRQSAIIGKLKTGKDLQRYCVILDA
ncbi:hypothetical protein G6F37_011712 [Rhizopus arrhizus]|nr:hypothetical protein G6F38_011729 [Rhizopus arrhizus]KAG1147861.1 hypothetical protein G6F37_011712 [Rhizopus arrhizus]